MKPSHKTKNLLETLLIIGLILIIPLFFVIKAAANKPTVPNTAVPLPPTTANAPEDSNAPNPKQPPACTFPLAQTTTAESTPEEYTFSEPQVVLTAPQGNIYNIAEWLPDNQQVLITEELRNVIVGNDTPLLESISLYNPETGESKIYAVRQLTHESPAWMPELNAVIYSAINYTNIDRKNHSAEFTRQVWASYGNPDTAQILADNLTQLSIAIKPGGSETLYLSDKKIAKLDKSLKKLSALSLDYAQWDYGKGWRNRNPVSYKMTWQPNTALIFLYSSGGVMGGGGYTFILNANTGSICELDFGGWVSKALWSSDGRYLAVGRATESHPADLTLLDITTGNLIALRGIPEGTEGQLYVSDFIWAPDNHHLLAIGNVISPQNFQAENDDQGLYLVDITSSQSVRVADYTSTVSSEGNNWAWSPNGFKLLMRCPTHVADQICLMFVQKIGQ